MAGPGKSAIGSQTKASNRSRFKEHWGYFKVEQDAQMMQKKKNTVHIYYVFGKYV